MTEKKITRKEQAQNTRKKLLDTAITLFKKYGYEKVTIEQICKEADVTTGAFYHHLKSKAGVIIEGYVEYDDFVREKEVGILNKDSNATEKIIDCIFCQIDFALTLGVQAVSEIYKVQITEENMFFLSDDRPIFNLIKKIIVLGQENNEFLKEISPEEATKEILVISRGVIYNWCQYKGEYDIAKYAPLIVRNYLKAYTAL